MEKVISIYGFDVSVVYRENDGQIEIIKTHVKDGTSASAIGNLDIVSEAKEILEAALLEQEDLFAEETLDKEKPF